MSPRPPSIRLNGPALLGGAALAAIGLAVLLTDQLYPGVDARFALLWGEEMLAGVRPDFAGAVPEKHPLTIAVGALVSQLPADAAIVAVIAISIALYGLLGYAIFRFGRALAGPFAGLLAAAVVLTRPELVGLLATSEKDVPFAGLTLLAAAFVVEEPRRRWPAALALLALAGLIRPEAWLLSGLLVAWVAYDSGGRLARRAFLYAATAPAVWVAFDLIVTGDPLQTLNHLRAEEGPVADEVALPLPSDGGDPSSYLKSLDLGIVELISPAVALGGIAVAALLALFAPRAVGARREARLGLAVAAILVAVGLIGVAVLDLLGAPLVGRFLLIPAITLAVLWAAAIELLRGARSALRPGAVKALAAAVLLAGAVSLLLAAPDDAEDVDQRLTTREQVAAATDDARALAEQPSVAAALAGCPLVATIGNEVLVNVLGRLEIALELELTLRRLPVRRPAVEPPEGGSAFVLDDLEWSFASRCGG